MFMEMRAREVFEQSNGEVTRAYYAQLQLHGPIGVVAMNLFRAQKTSTRAKRYRGRRFKSAAYDVKAYSMSELCRTLAASAAELGMRYGWKADPDTRFGEEPSWVLYVDTPYGQISFHAPSRGQGPDYPGEWDRSHASETRILAFCDAVMSPCEAADLVIRS
jgi:hypothetical protein